MDNVETLLKGTVEELDRLLNAKNVLGEPIEKGNATVIPIVSYGFGFGAGGGGNGKSGDGAGTGAGGGGCGRPDCGLSHRRDRLHHCLPVQDRRSPGV